MWRGRSSWALFSDEPPCGAVCQSHGSQIEPDKPVGDGNTKSDRGRWYGAGIAADRFWVGLSNQRGTRS